MIKLVVFDFFATLFDPHAQALFPDAIPLVEWVKTNNLMAAIFTNSSGWALFFTDEQLQLFDDTLEVDAKGSAELEIILAKLKVEPKETVVIGDSLNREIAAGKALGTRTIWVGGKTSNDPLHPVASNLSVTRSILEQWLKKE